VDRISQIFFQRPKERTRQRRLEFVAIFISSRDIPRSKSKVVVKPTKFWTFFALPNFKGAVPPKVVRALTP